MWLIKAYIKKLGKRIFIFFLLGLVFFFVFYLILGSFLAKVPIVKNESIGLVGAYTVDNLPASVLDNLSMGLTGISADGTPQPAAAKSWKIENEGKKYVFHLKTDLLFSDGTRLTSSLINYNFSDAKVEKPDKDTVIFTLKDKYSPFLITVSKPIFKKGFVGLGEYKVKKLKLNGNFVEFISLSSIKDSRKTLTYQFYPSGSALKLAFLLGEISRAKGFFDSRIKNVSLFDFRNVEVERKVNYEQLVSLFYNTQDSSLSDKKLRNALSYALPDDFQQGKRAYSFYPPSFWAYANQYERAPDLAHSKVLLTSSGMASNSASLKLAIKTLPRYKDSAVEIQNAWKKIGIESKIEVVDSIPSEFQIFLGDFYLPKDPDQYVLWHSNQDSNISKLKDLRIDKLLEDGRKTEDLNVRKKIYADLQKYLLDSAPAAFLYFPYEYEIRRK